jgi:AraC family transcriptional regulator
MPQQLSVLRSNSGSSGDRAASCERAPPGQNGIGTALVIAHLDDIAESGSAVCGGPVLQQRMTLEFRHLDVVLAIAARGPGQNSAAEGNAILNAMSLRSGSSWEKGRHHRLEITDNPDHEGGRREAESPEDAVLKRLSDALGATEGAGGRYTGICADALRLAIVTRLLGLQSGAEPSAHRTDRANDGSAERKMRALQKWRLKRVVEYVDDHLSGKITLLDLAAVAGLSRMHFASQFRSATGCRPHEYLLRRRIQCAEELLRQSTMTLVEIALAVGFQTQAHFTTVFKRFVGDTPYQWRSARCAKAGF